MVGRHAAEAWCGFATGTDGGRERRRGEGGGGRERERQSQYLSHVPFLGNRSIDRLIDWRLTAPEVCAASG